MTYRIVQLIAIAGCCIPFAVSVRAADKSQRVELTTSDGVELSGEYQTGRLGNKSPAVLILDGIGENRRPKLCEAIAAELQKQGCATLRFDFRGHGESRSVNETFWNVATNRRLVRGYRSSNAPDRIEFDDFKRGYLRTLVNDVAAARAFLDRRNDAGECNTSQLLVIGLREGASIGAMWVATEWNRYRVTGGYYARLAPNPEGRDVLGCVWIEPELELDRQKVPMLDSLKRAVVKRSTYIGLVHASDDAPLDKLSNQCADSINRKNGRLFQAISLDVRENGNATDHASLVPTVTGIVEQMRKVQEPPPWDDRDFADNRYAWSLPGGGFVIAKTEDERIMKSVPVDRLISR
jgi:pimeloyl-ACP methyl ester carboxylesterase